MAYRVVPWALAAAATLGGVVACREEAVPALAPIALDTTRVAVAGVSSGAYMATQVHLALNARVRGAALVAGGPYGCAGGNLDAALGPCMTAQPAPPDAAALVAQAKERAADQRIDALEAFAGDRVLVWHGTNDAIVAPSLARVVAAVYRELGGPALSVTLDDRRAFGHGLPTLDGGTPCDAPASPWLLDCGIDAAGEAMHALFGEDPTAPRADTAAPDAPAPMAGGVLARFDQTALAPGDAVGLADTGFVYTPASCHDAPCGALLVFHGCQQNAGAIGETFIRDAGFNRWADWHRVVVVYPQTQSSYVPLNPKACWDWWGYGGADYDTREGRQIRFVGAILDRLAQPR